MIHLIERTIAPVNHNANLKHFSLLLEEEKVSVPELLRMVKMYRRIHRDGLKPVDAVIESKNSRPRVTATWGELL